MITALMHSLGTISFPLMWQYPDLAVQGVCAQKVLEASITTYRSLVSFMFMAERWQGQMTWVEEKVAGCCVGPGVESKGLLSETVHACWTQDLASRPCAVHHQGQEPATDRVWFGQMDGRTRVVCCWEGQTTVWNFTTGFEIIAQASTASFYSLIKSVSWCEWT